MKKVNLTKKHYTNLQIGQTVIAIAVLTYAAFIFSGEFAAIAVLISGFLFSALYYLRQKKKEYDTHELSLSEFMETTEYSSTVYEAVSKFIEIIKEYRKIHLMTIQLPLTYDNGSIIATVAPMLYVADEDFLTPEETQGRNAAVIQNYTELFDINFFILSEEAEEEIILSNKETFRVINRFLPHAGLKEVKVSTIQSLDEVTRAIHYKIVVKKHISFN